MKRTAMLATMTALGLVVSRPSWAQSAPSPSAPLATERPKRIGYAAGTPVPLGYHVESVVRPGLVIAGSVVAGLSYAFGVGTLGVSGCSADHWMWLPFAGPLIALGKESERVTSGPCDDPEALRHAARAWSGIGQGVGGGLLLLAAVHRKTYLVADSATREAQANAQRTLAIVPSLGPSTAGLSVLGTF